jgi:hypothetical protein
MKSGKGSQARACGIVPKGMDHGSGRLKIEAVAALH